MNITGTKSIFSSLTAWGVGVTLAGYIGSFFGVTVTSDDVQTGFALVKQTYDLAMAMAVPIGALMSLIGRLRAKKTVTITGSPSQ